jgi:hypothetical protein
MLVGGIAHAELAGLSDGDKKFPYDNAPGVAATATEDLPTLIGQTTTTADGSGSLSSLLNTFGFGGAEYEGVPKALIYVKFIINLLL